MTFNIEDTFTKGQVLDQLCTDQNLWVLAGGGEKFELRLKHLPNHQTLSFKPGDVQCHNKTLEMIVLPPGIVDIW